MQNRAHRKRVSTTGDPFNAPQSPPTPGHASISYDAMTGNPTVQLNEIDPGYFAAGSGFYQRPMPQQQLALPPGAPISHDSTGVDEWGVPTWLGVGAGIGAVGGVGMYLMDQGTPEGELMESLDPSQKAELERMLMESGAVLGY